MLAQNKLWLPIEGYPGYFVSRLGEVRHGEKLLVPRKVAGGRYRAVHLHKRKQKYIHRLVAAAFIGKIASGFHVNHLDGDPGNNELSNLEICTPWENSQHYWHPEWYVSQIRIPGFDFMEERT